MKMCKTSILLAAISVGLAPQLRAADLINDTWIDGTRTDPAAPTYSEAGVDSDGDGNLESAWYGTGGSGSTFSVVNANPGVTPGILRGTVNLTGSSSWTTYFGSSPITLANPGDQLKLTWAFTPTSIDTTNNGQSFRIALVDTPDADRVSTDVAPGSSTYAGYAMFMNMATTLNRSTPFELRERSAPAVSSAFLSSSGSWTSGLADDGNTGDGGYEEGVLYTFQFTATRTLLNELDINVSMTGGTLLGGDGSLVVSFLDTTPNSFSFDTFGIRPSRADQSAGQFDTSLFQVEFLQVPEPTVATLAGLGLFGLIAARRNRR